MDKKIHFALYITPYGNKTLREEGIGVQMKRQVKLAHTIVKRVQITFSFIIIR